MTLWFMNVLLEETTILRRIYEKKEIISDAPKNEIMWSIRLMYKNALFTFNNSMYKQNGSVTMGS